MHASNFFFSFPCRVVEIKNKKRGEEAWLICMFLFLLYELLRLFHHVVGAFLHVFAELSHQPILAIPLPLLAKNRTRIRKTIGVD
jgi:hypothetical protein